MDRCAKRGEYGVGSLNKKLGKLSPRRSWDLGENKRNAFRPSTQQNPPNEILLSPTHFPALLYFLFLFRFAFLSALLVLSAVFSSFSFFDEQEAELSGSRTNIKGCMLPRAHMEYEIEMRNARGRKINQERISFLPGNGTTNSFTRI